MVAIIKYYDKCKKEDLFSFFRRSNPNINVEYKYFATVFDRVRQNLTESETGTEKSEASVAKISKDLVKPTQNSKRTFKSSNPNATVDKLKQPASPKSRQENWEKTLGDIDKIDAATKKKRRLETPNIECVQDSAMISDSDIRPLEGTGDSESDQIYAAHIDEGQLTSFQYHSNESENNSIDLELSEEVQIVEHSQRVKELTEAPQNIVFVNESHEDGACYEEVITESEENVSEEAFQDNNTHITVPDGFTFE